MSGMTEEELNAMIAELEGDVGTETAPAKEEPGLSKEAEEQLEALGQIPSEPEPAPEPAAPVASPEPEVKTNPAPEKAEVTPENVAVEPEVAAPVEKKVLAMTDGTALNQFIDGDKLRSDVSINSTDLDSAMMEHASLYVHYATQTVKARRQYERLKSGFEILEAKLDAEYRESLVKEGKKPTEAAIRNALVADKRWSGSQAKVIEAQSIWKMCEVAESALTQRKDLLLEIARDRRKEKEGQMRVLEAQNLRDSVLESIQRASRAA